MLAAAFAAVREAQACLSRFEADSDLARFHALRRGESMLVRDTTRRVLEAAAELQSASEGAFDISLGSAPEGWHCDGNRLHKLDNAVRLDLGGIGKGQAVDAAVDALIAHGCVAGWVNAGGDLRAFGDAELPIRLRDEATGGARPFASLRDGAFATSHYGPGSRSQLANRARGLAPSAHVSVAAPLCLWADALTKVIALSGDTAHPLLARFGAQAWLH
jgi:thiamine biosynthesis lipoprotein